MIGSPHLTVTHEPEFDRCIRETHRGQAGWAGWKAPAETCANCLHFHSGARLKQDGYCALYRERMTGDTTVRKFPASAKACRDFVMRNLKLKNIGRKT